MERLAVSRSLSASSKRQLEDAAKALHADECGDFQSIYHHLFAKAVECGGFAGDGSRSKHPILSIVRTKDPADQPYEPLERIDDVIGSVCADPDYRTWLKAAPMAALASVGASLPATARDLVETAEADANLLINVAQAQTTAPIDDIAAQPQEGVVAVAIGVTIVLSGVGVVVAVIIRRRRKK